MSEVSIGVVRWYSISNYPLSWLPIHSPFQRQATGSKLVEPREKDPLTKLLASNLMTSKVWYQKSVSRHHFIWDFTRPKLLPFLSASEDHGFAVPEKSRKMEELERLSTTALMHCHFQSSKLFYENMKYDMFWQFRSGDFFPRPNSPLRPQTPEVISSPRRKTSRAISNDWLRVVCLSKSSLCQSLTRHHL